MGSDQNGNPVYLKDIWPTSKEITTRSLPRSVRICLRKTMPTFSKAIHAGIKSRHRMAKAILWGADSTYIKNPPYFDGMSMSVGTIDDIHGARVLGLFGDSITTDHISPAGNIKANSPAGRYLQGRGVAPTDFNSYGSRRGNDDVMVRGTFANIRIKNLMLGGERRWQYHSLPRPKNWRSMMLPFNVSGRQGSVGRHGRQGIRYRFFARLGSERHHVARHKP